MAHQRKASSMVLKGHPKAKGGKVTKSAAHSKTVRGPRGARSTKVVAPAEPPSSVDENEETHCEEMKSSVEDHDQVTEEEEKAETEEVLLADSEDDSPTGLDFFDAQFDDTKVAAAIFPKIALIEQSATPSGSAVWNKRASRCPALGGQMVDFSLTSSSASDVPEPVSTPPQDQGEVKLEEFHIKKRLLDQWNLKVAKGKSPAWTPLQAQLFQSMHAYKDILFSNESHENAEKIQQAYCLHALNHVFKTRDRVLKNTAKINEAARNANREVPEFRDQGFTRPKVLILLPFKHSALQVVQHLVDLSGATQQENKKRFHDEFSLAPEEDHVDPRKSDDFKKTFAGNIDDSFRVGIKMSRKHLKLYADFYSSDIIVASPLGLRTLIGAEGDKKRDFDFLSSIEVLIIDRACTMLMQNWDHVLHVLDHMNKIPKESHGCDFSRVKSIYLDGNAKYCRQLLLFSDFITPEFNHLFSHHFKSVAGKVKVGKSFVDGTVASVVHNRLPQVFHRVPCSSITASHDARFNYFVQNVLPKITGPHAQKRTLLFIPAYFDFVRIRNYMQDGLYNFSQICEYTSNPDISRARFSFFHGQSNVLLYTERAHFFRRFVIRGGVHIIFYGLPENASFYSELVNMLDSSAGTTVPGKRDGGYSSSSSVSSTVNLSVSALFTRYDTLGLERIVGKERAVRMIQGSKDTFLFT